MNANTPKVATCPEILAILIGPPNWEVSALPKGAMVEIEGICIK